MGLVGGWGVVRCGLVGGGVGGWWKRKPYSGIDSRLIVVVHRMIVTSLKLISYFSSLEGMQPRENFLVISRKFQSPVNAARVFQPTMNHLKLYKIN